MKITKAHITIYVADMDRAIAFYLSIGFEMQQRWDNHYAILIGGGVEFGLHPADSTDKSDRTGISIGLNADDFEGAKSKLSELNIAFTERSEGEGDYLIFNDLDGTSLYFIRPKW